jgi:hypothetical protein
MVQWSIGIQRELTRDFMIEASYVGNRGAWWESSELINVNALSGERLASFGLDINDPADQALLKSRLNQTPAINAGFGTPPYEGFPLTNTVAQALRPFPQFTNITYKWAPLGRTWYDSLQIKATKRFSHGLDFTSSFTWQKELMMGAEQVGQLATTQGVSINNVFDRGVNKYISRLSRPFVWVTALNYTLPTLGGNKALSWAIRDWRIGAVLQYSSGMPIQVPTAQTTLSSMVFQSTFANRVPGEPFWAPGVDINDRSTYDPFSDFVLNPKAWVDPVNEGQFGTSPAYYSDYRYMRRPSEKMSIGRTFRLKEGITLSIRADFDNIFNRLVIGDPTATNAKATQTRETTGETKSGFGDINTNAGTVPRSGIIVARIQF